MVVAQDCARQLGSPQTPEAGRYLRAHAGRRVSMTTLCRELGAREWTFYLGFRERYGMSPQAYLAMLRMDAARKALLTAPPETRVTDIALDVGITHLGRFSTEYRRRFGAPAATLASGNRVSG